MRQRARAAEHGSQATPWLGLGLRLAHASASPSPNPSPSLALALTLTLARSVGPPDGRWSAHLAIFSACIVLRYLCALGNYIENAFGSPRQRKRVLRKHTVHVAIYGLVTVILPVLYFADILIYKAQNRQGIDPPIPWYVLEIRVRASASVRVRLRSRIAILQLLEIREISP